MKKDESDVMQENMPQVFNLHMTFNDTVWHKAHLTKINLSISVK